jgi:hypothetical protein
MHGTLIHTTVQPLQTSASVTVASPTLAGTVVWIMGAIISNPTSAPATLKLRKGDKDIFLIRVGANDSEFFPVPFRVDLATGETLTLIVEGGEGVYGAVVTGAG